MNAVLALTDQTLFDAERAAGTTSVIQCAWTYDRGIDLDCLRRFHRHLQRGRLSRRVERSPLPFGRHRWVSPADTTRLEIAPARPRAEFDAWLGEQAGHPLDPEHGPGWRLAVLPFTDGGTGVALTVAHSLTDGLGLCRALAQAAQGCDDAIAWPAGGSRGWWRAIRDDARQTLRDVPAVRQAVRAAVGMGRPAESAGVAGTVPGGPVSLAATTIFVDTEEWDARATQLGGTGNSLLAGLAADVARRAGRTTNGTVTLSIPVDERQPDDTRANAVTNVDVIVDPTGVSTDLRPVRTDIKKALIRHNEFPDERVALLPLVPLLPRWVFRKMLSVATGGTTNVVSSNLGDIDGWANRPDGHDADSFSIRSLYPGLSAETVQRLGGVLAFLSGRINGRVFVSVLASLPDFGSVLASLPDQPNSIAVLDTTVFDALAAFDLTGRTL